MKRVLFPLSVLLLCVGFGCCGPVIAGGPHEKATGSVTVNNPNHPERWHYFQFVAHELESGPLGKGFLVHEELDADGTVTDREEYCTVEYVLVIGDTAWFAGPILYDSAIPDPTRWMVLMVTDGGQPGRAHDNLRWTRRESEGEAFDMVVNGAIPAAPTTVQRGNLTVHSASGRR